MNESTKPEANETIFEAEEIDDVVDRLHDTALRLDALHALNCEQTAERKRLAEELAAERRLADELEKELDFKRREADAFGEQRDAAHKRVAELETELNAANGKTAELSRALEVARHNADVADKRFVEVGDRLRTVEADLAATTKKNATLSNLAEALKSERDANARTAESRRLAVARRDDELTETRRQRDDFERIAREARRENWFWRVVGFVSAATFAGTSWAF